MVKLSGPCMLRITKLRGSNSGNGRIDSAGAIENGGNLIIDASVASRLFLSFNCGICGLYYAAVRCLCL